MGSCEGREAGVIHVTTDLTGRPRVASGEEQGEEAMSYLKRVAAQQEGNRTVEDMRKWRQRRAWFSGMATQDYMYVPGWWRAKGGIPRERPSEGRKP